MSYIFHFKKHDLVYFAVPKVANTSIRSWLLPLISNVPYEEIQNIHQDVDWPRIPKSRYLKMAPSNLSFAVIRNPWERIVSTYTDKICRDEVHPPLGKLGFTANMSFADYVNLVARIPDRKADVHIRSQWAFISYRNQLLPDVVVDISELYKIPKLLKGWKLDVQQLGTIATLNKTNKKKNIDHLFDSPEQHEMFERVIRKRFKREIVLFGYEYPYKNSSINKNALQDSLIIT